MASEEMRLLQMPKMLYGTAWKRERTTELVIKAIQAGFRGIDTACQPKHYREDLVGKALTSIFASTDIKREDLFIQTKYTSLDGQDLSQTVPYDPKAPIAEQVSQSFKTSLRNLGVEYIDSVVLHSPLRTREQTLEAYRVLETFVSTGQVRQLGISNIYNVSELDWLISEVSVPVSVVQNRWYQGNGWDWDVYDLCQRNNIQYQSFWTLTGSPLLLRHPTLRKIAKTHNLRPEQTLYKICQLWNIHPLCGSTTLKHVEEALAVGTFEDLRADDEDVVALQQVMRGIQ